MNILPRYKQIEIIAALTEGMSIRSVERLTGVHRDTIMRLGIRVGEACAKIQDAKMRNVQSAEIQVDEIWGFSMPDIGRITTSHVEKRNHTLRMHCRRLTRLTNAFSKKLENFEAAVALNFAYYNFCKRHITIKTTPVRAAGVEDHEWTVAELVERCGE